MQSRLPLVAHVLHPDFMWCSFCSICSFLSSSCRWMCILLSFFLLVIALPVFLWLMASAYPFDIFKLYFSFRQYSTIWRLLLKSLCGLSDIFQTPSQRYGCIEIWYEFQNVWMYDFFLDLFTNVVCFLSSLPLQFVMVFFLLMCCLVSLFLSCSPMLYVFYEFITPPFMMESVLLIVLALCWLVQQCCLSFLSSPLPSVCLDPCCLSV